jgi:hypothetical protein
MKSSPTNKTKILYPSTRIRFIPISFIKDRTITNSNGIHPIKYPVMFIQISFNLFSLALILKTENPPDKINNYSKTVLPPKKIK